MVPELFFTHDMFLSLFVNNMYDGLMSVGVSEASVSPLLDELEWRMRADGKKPHLFIGMAEMLNTLSKKATVIVITSNVSGIVAEDLERGGVNGVQAVLGGDVDRQKARKISNASERYQADCTYYIGDTQGDMREAVCAHAIPLGVQWGWHSVAALEEAGASDILTQPQDMLNLF